MKNLLCTKELLMMLEKTNGNDSLSKLEKFKNENFGNHFEAATSPEVWKELAGDNKSPDWMHIRDDLSVHDLICFYDPKTVSAYYKPSK